MKRKLALATLALAALPVCLPLARAEEQPTSLYERLGGLKNIAPLVDDFVNHLLMNETLNGNPAINTERRNSPPPYLKFQLSQLLCEMSGGPCVYSGESLKEALLPLKVSKREWEAMAQEFKRTMIRCKVAAPEQKELIELVARTRPEIIAAPEEITAEAPPPQVLPSVAEPSGEIDVVAPGIVKKKVAP